MKQINKTDVTKMVRIETLEMVYDNQEEFDLHSEELHQQGWDRDIYSQVYNWVTGEHEYVLYTRETDISLRELIKQSSNVYKTIYEQEEKSIDNAIETLNKHNK